VGDERAETLSEKARRVLQAAVVEAYGRPGEYVTHDPVMRRANIADPEEFRTIAEYLDRCTRSMDSAWSMSFTGSR
jgi:hypothetical protein